MIVIFLWGETRKCQFFFFFRKAICPEGLAPNNGTVMEMIDLALQSGQPAISQNENQYIVTYAPGQK